VSRAETLVTVPQAVELEGITGAFTVAGHSGTRQGRPPGVSAFRAARHARGGVRTRQGPARRADAAPDRSARDGAGRDLRGRRRGLDPALKIGDVVVGVTTVEHDYTLRFIQRPLPCHRAAADLVQELMRAADRVAGEFAVRFGPIASGDEDVIDPARAGELHAATGALCVAWEGAGAARAACFSGVPFVEVRALTDAADATDFRANLDRSSNARPAAAAPARCLDFSSFAEAG
jgi:phosphorylase superfamily protein